MKKYYAVLATGLVDVYYKPVPVRKPLEPIEQSYNGSMILWNKDEGIVYSIDKRQKQFLHKCRYVRITRGPDMGLSTWVFMNKGWCYWTGSHYNHISMKRFEDKELEN